jgi:uncharacterized phage infection (PIP) family protein YhgE
VIARALLVIAAVGVLVGIAGTIVAWRLAGRLQTGVDESLSVAQESLVTTEQSITVISRVLNDVDALIGTVGQTVGDTATTVSNSTAALDSLADATPALTNGVVSLRDNIDEIAGLLETLETVIEAIGRLPGVPDYAPSQSLANALRELRPSLDPIVEGLSSINTSMSQLDRDSQPLVNDLRELQRSLDTLRADVTESKTLLDEYQSTARRAQTIATDVKTDLGNDLTQTRLLIIITGVLFIVGQIVPLALSRLFFGQVLRAETTADTSTYTR